MSQENTPLRFISSDNPTFAGRGISDPAERPPSPYEAFVLAYDRVRALADIAPPGAAIVAAISPRRRLVDAAIVEDGQALILGRHSRCGLRLPAPEIALRHAAMLVRSEDGVVITRIWDLNTGARFYTEDAQPQAAVIADGPFYISIHGYALWIVPRGVAAGWSGRAVEAWSTLPERVYLDRRPAPAEPSTPRKPPPLPTTPPPARPRGADQEISYVTSIGAPLVLGDPEGVEVAWGVLRIEHGPQRRQHEVSAERLERGILVGRYDRCGIEIDNAERGISRVHALLVKIAGSVWAIDTASTNGLWRDGEQVEAEVLDDIDALQLGEAATLRWERCRHPEA